MCELFAMSARLPATVRMSMEEFSRHGGLSGPHKDGWGVAWYDERDLRLVKERFPAAGSACVRFLQDHPFASTLVLGHVRKATRGDVALRNCQPFVRELGGAWHAFAHNGDLAGIDDAPRLGAHRFRAVGETDSERAFCALLERMAALWIDGRTPALDARRQVVEDVAGELRGLGPANLLYCDGDALFVHADRRHQRDDTIRPPGLWRLDRACTAGGRLECEGLGIVTHPQSQQVVLVASVPLTAEPWTPMARGEVIAMRLGALQPARAG